jgi:hypothetical protein
LTFGRIWRTRTRMPRNRAGAAILYGGWLLLFNPNPDRPSAPLDTWKKMHDYDTPFACQQKLREEVLAAAKKGGKAETPGALLTPPALRYRCARAETVPRPR